MNPEDFKSDLERNVYKQLRHKQRKYSYEVSYEDTALDYSIPRRYIPDFILRWADGRTIFVEAKGYLRTSDRNKLIAVKKGNPGIDLRLLFMKDNKINKSSKMRYSDWCKKYGFKYAIGKVPNEWFEIDE